MKLSRFIVGWLVVFILTGCNERGIIYETDEVATTAEYDKSGMEDEIENGLADDSIYVYVCGCVCKPGVYKLDVTARVFDAIDAAGGVTEDGDAGGLAQAQTMSDGMTIYVPSHEERETQNTIEAVESEDDGLVNINTADRERLMTIPGIGQSKADAIIAYREEHGRFTAIEDLMQISGIKQGVFDKIKAYIKVSG